ncbi:unnamed protein product [Knipowitschia caucasica]
MSAIWDYFSLVNSDSQTTTCNICKVAVSRGGNKKAHFNTTNLIRHLERNHAAEYDLYKSKTAKQQQTLAEAFRRHELLPQNSDRSRKITQRVVEYIALDDQPISVVENVGFCRLMKFLEPRYELPSRRYISFPRALQ